jgi:1-deoxy-D-xylulose-5-phosphate synthase
MPEPVHIAGVMDGPIDGHDLQTLIKTLKNLKAQNRPRLLHLITKKGYGLDRAENDPCKFHGIAPVLPTPLQR